MTTQDLIRALDGKAWALLPGKLAELANLAVRLLAGRATEENLQAALGGRTQPPERRGVIAVLPIYGVLRQRDSWSPGTDSLGRAFRALAADPDVKGIVLDVDSPGGEVFGTEEFGNEIAAVRDVKPVFAVANSLAASAAYWLASQATRVYVTPGGDVGSIGVWTAHMDLSKALEEFGIKVTLISAGKYKTEGNPFQPLSEDGLGHIQGVVDEAYDRFVRAVARGRRVSESEVRGGMGEGRVVSSRRALAMGMVDGIATLDEAIATMQGELAAIAGRGRVAEAVNGGVQAGGPAEPTARRGQDEVLRLLNETKRRQ